jgi:hypothetical protein
MARSNDVLFFLRLTTLSPAATKVGMTIFFFRCRGFIHMDEPDGNNSFSARVHGSKGGIVVTVSLGPSPSTVAIDQRALRCLA